MKGIIELVVHDKNLHYKVAVQMILTTKIMRIKG
ncbi:hypothetical protein LCGC14_2572470 [marine sediment metagenome]|uniref:Uncharacterized protein n=1 Tax=marine sediment metagenome TaxID=412755 RepID=A0A0F9D9P7_9ZZZZ